MIKSRYILTLLAMLLSMVARGQDFNPDSPPEPGARYKLTVKAEPKEAATVYFTCICYQTVHNGICQGRITYVIIPFGNGKL